MPHIMLTVAPWTALDNAVGIEHRPARPRTPQMIIGGYIETAPHLTLIEINGKRVRCTVDCNDNACLEGMQRNHSMSKLWKAELLRQRPNAEFSYEPSCLVW